MKIGVTMIRGGSDAHSHARCTNKSKFCVAWQALFSYVDTADSRQSYEMPCEGERVSALADVIGRSTLCFYETKLHIIIPPVSLSSFVTRLWATCNQFWIFNSLSLGINDPNLTHWTFRGLSYVISLGRNLSFF